MHTYVLLCRYDEYVLYIPMTCSASRERRGPMTAPDEKMVQVIEFGAPKELSLVAEGPPPTEIYFVVVRFPSCLERER